MIQGPPNGSVSVYDLLGKSWQEIRDEWLHPDPARPAAFAIRFGRTSPNSANFNQLRRVVTDGDWADAAVIYAASECGMIEGCHLRNGLGAALLVCNAHGPSHPETMKQLTVRDTQLTSNGVVAPLRILQQSAMVGDIHLRGGGLNTSGPCPAAVHVTLAAQQLETLTLEAVCIECESAGALLRFDPAGFDPGQRGCQPGGIALRDLRVLVRGPLIYAPGVTLATVTLDNVDWLPTDRSAPRILCAAIGTLVYNGQRFNQSQAIVAGLVRIQQGRPAVRTTAAAVNVAPAAGSDNVAT